MAVAAHQAGLRELLDAHLHPVVEPLQLADVDDLEPRREVLVVEPAFRQATEQGDLPALVEGESLRTGPAHGALAAAAGRLAQTRPTAASNALTCFVFAYDRSNFMT